MLSFRVCGSSYLRHFTRQRYKSIIFSKLIIFSSSYRNRIVFDINEEKIRTTDKTNDIPHVYKSPNLDFFNRLLPALFVSVVFLHFVQIIFHIVHVLLDWSLNLIIKYFIIYQELPVVNTFVNHRFSGLQLLLTLLHLSTKKNMICKTFAKVCLTRAVFDENFVTMYRWLTFRKPERCTTSVIALHFHCNPTTEILGKHDWVLCPIVDCI